MADGPGQTQTQGTAREGSSNGQGPGGGDGNQPAPEQKKKKPNPVVRMIGILVIVVVVVIALIAGLRYLTYASAHETTDDAQVDADIAAVTSKISERVNVIEVDTNQYVRRGQILVHLADHDERQRYAQALANYNAARAQADAAAQTVGLTVDQVQAQVQQSNGSIGQARAGILSAQEQAREAEDQIRVAQSGVQTAEAQVSAAESVLPGIDQNERRTRADLERNESLVRTGDAAQSQLDAALAAEATARSDRDQALATIRVQQANLAGALEKLAAQRSALGASNAAIALQDATLTSAQGKLAEQASPFRVSTQRSNAEAQLAQVATARAQLNQARDQLSYTVIRSPIDGYIGEKDVEVGKTVAPGETLLTLVPSKNLYITANYKETQIGEMRRDQDVDISIDAYHGREFKGKLVAVGPASQNTYSLVPAQNATGNFVKITQRIPVRIRVTEGDDEHHPLRVGMSVEASVRTK